MPQLKTKEETALHFKVSAWTVDRWVKSGKIQAIKVGRRVLFDVDSIVKSYTAPKTIA